MTDGTPFDVVSIVLTQTLLHFLWQGAVLGLIAGLATTLLQKRKTAGAWYGVQVSILAAMLLCPVVTAIVVAGGTPAQPPPPPVSVPDDSGLPDAPGQPGVFGIAPQSNPEDAEQTRPGMFGLRPPEEVTPTVSPDAKPEEGEAPGLRIDAFAPYVALAYFAGVLILLLRLAAALHGGRRLQRASVQVTEPSLLDTLAKQAAAIGLRYTPALAYCSRVAVPTIVGVIKPVILLPLRVQTGFTTEQIEMLLLHELAHLRRYDHIVNLVQRLAEAVLFFHPAVWYVSRQISDAREHCCDDLVLQHGGRPGAYAELLVRADEYAQAHGEPALAELHVVNGPSRLRRRIARILGADVPIRLSRAGFAGLVATILIAASTLAVMASSREEEESESEQTNVAEQAAPGDDGTDTNAAPLVDAADEEASPASEKPIQVAQRAESTVVTDAPDQIPIPEGTQRVTHVDDTAEGRRSFGGSGHAVVFDRPDDARYLEAIQIAGSRYGTAQPPDEDFLVYVLNGQHEKIATVSYPYSKLERGELRWYTLSVPSIEVPERFVIGLSFNPHRTKGVYVALDEDVEESHSLRGLPDSGYEPVDGDYDWMVRVYLAQQAERTDEPGQRSARSDEGVMRTVRLVEQLNSGDPWVSKIAAQKMGESGILQYARFLIPVLIDEDNPPEVRAACAEALGAIGDPQAVPYLVSALRYYDDPGDEKIAWAAATALSRINDPSVLEMLQVALDDIDAGLRAGAYHTLGKIGSPEAIDLLIQRGLGDVELDNSNIVESALRKLAPDSAVLSDIIAALDDERRAQGAMQTLALVGTEAATNAIVQQLNSRTVIPSSETTGALLMLSDDPEVVKALADLLYEGLIIDHHTRVLEAINRHKLMPEEPEEREILLFFAGAYHRALSLGERGTELLVRALEIEENHLATSTSRDPRILRHLIEILGETGDPQAIEALEQYVVDNRYGVALSAVDAIGDIGTTNAIPVLIDALKSVEFNVRGNAAHHLGELKAKEAVEPLILLLWDMDSDAQVSAARALAKIGDSRAVPPLIDALDGSSVRVRVSAIRALGDLGDPRAVQPLKELAARSFEAETVKALRIALRQLDADLEK